MIAPTRLEYFEGKEGESLVACKPGSLWRGGQYPQLAVAFVVKADTASIRRGPGTQVDQIRYHAIGICINDLAYV